MHHHPRHAGQIVAGREVDSRYRQGKPEVVVQVEVLEARTDRLRTWVSFPVKSHHCDQPERNDKHDHTGGTPTTTNSGITLNQLRNLNGGSYAVTLPSLTVKRRTHDTNTKIIQNPEIRSVDGQQPN